MTEPHPTSRTTLHEVLIDASPARVFEALTRDIGAWWSRDFLVGGERAKRFVLEERVGGSVFEDWGDGQGLEWYRVVGFERGKQLLLAGELFASFGGPARVQEDFQLAAEGSKTRLTLRESLLGPTSDGTAANLAEGWRFLLLDCLRAHVEKP